MPQVTVDVYISSVVGRAQQCHYGKHGRHRESFGLVVVSCEVILLGEKRGPS